MSQPSLTKDEVQAPPDRLQMEEIFRTAIRIRGVWKRVASLTSLFITYEIDDISCSRDFEDETIKALTMLRQYMERGGTRERLAGALEKLGLTSLSQDVRFGSFIDTELLPDATLQWVPKSRKHRDRFEKLIKVESKNLKRIGPAAVCFDKDFIIGRGSAGTCVYIGLWEDGSEVAVKRVLTSSCEEMAMNECKFVNLAESTNSRHLVRCRYFKEIGDFYYFVLDLFEETLQHYVEKQSQTKESLEDNGPIIIKELLTGLQALHCGEQKIVHMDLKPSNILVDIEGHMHLTDFGISRIVPEGQSTVNTVTIGTIGWRAVETLPKQLNNQQTTNRVKQRRRSDIQVMGMICFYILTKGNHPFGITSDECEKNLRNGRPVDWGEISNLSARDLISKMLEQDIKKRPHVDGALKHPYLQEQSGPQKRQQPPYRLQVYELAKVSQRISHIWRELAYLTKRFETYDIDNIRCSQPGENETSKALTMLLRYDERGGTRKELADALKEVGQDSLSKEVLSGEHD